MPVMSTRRSIIEQVNGRLKDEFGGCGISVRGPPVLVWGRPKEARSELGIMAKTGHILY